MKCEARRNSKVTVGNIGSHWPLITDHCFYASSRNRVSASPYSLRHTSRLIVTTVAAIIMVAASSRWKSPLSVAANGRAQSVVV